MKTLRERHEAEIERLRAEVANLRMAVVAFLGARGHELCHENRQELARAFGIELMECTQGLPPESEFAVRCIDYRKQLYGCDGPGSDEEAYVAEIARLMAEIQRMDKNHAELMAENAELRAAIRRRAESALQDAYAVEKTDPLLARERREVAEDLEVLIPPRLIPLPKEPCPGCVSLPTLWELCAAEGCQRSHTLEVPIKPSIPGPDLYGECSDCGQKYEPVEGNLWRCACGTFDPQRDD